MSVRVAPECVSGSRDRMSFHLNCAFFFRITRTNHFSASQTLMESNFLANLCRSLRKKKPALGKAWHGTSVYVMGGRTSDPTFWLSEKGIYIPGTIDVSGCSTH